MVSQKKKYNNRKISTPAGMISGQSKKWQKLFRYTAERKKAIHNLVVFVYLVNELAKQSSFSPNSIHDNDGGKIYL